MLKAKADIAFNIMFENGVGQEHSRLIRVLGNRTVKECMYNLTFERFSSVSSFSRVVV